MSAKLERTRGSDRGKREERAESKSAKEQAAGERRAVWRKREEKKHCSGRKLAGSKCPPFIHPPLLVPLAKPSALPSEPV